MTAHDLAACLYAWRYLIAFAALCVWLYARACRAVDDINRRIDMERHPSSPTRQARTYVDADAAGRCTFDDEAVARLVRGDAS